jgi:hypothetical protein
MPRTFTDTLGRTWSLALNVGAIRRAKAELGIDLLANVESDMRGHFALLNDEIVRFVDLLFWLCREQAAKAGVDDLGFAEGLGGDTLDRAQAAFTEELLDFFPQAKRTTLRRIWDKATLVMQKVLERDARRLEALDLETAADEVESILKTTAPSASGSGTPSKSSPASSATTSTGTPSAK